jgi:Raf kinase inhibitor-like YbhB/YbcL family protein
MRFAAPLTVLAVLAVASPAPSASTAKLDLESTEFRAGEPLPKSATCDAEGKSPELSWKSAPTFQPKSFALIVDDPDAPNGTFTHWVQFDIPGATRTIPHGASNIGAAGRNDFKNVGYGAACPPKGHGAHRYYFRLYALDIEKLGPGVGSARAKVEEAMRGHVIARGELMGTYERR